ncbi:MAG TPA: NAD(P)-dependent oxidoreductase [Chloroflexota bacterium]|nr:NAD(P)-dependent oxidoreductase [Chloroflexota bacterium]
MCAGSLAAIRANVIVTRNLLEVSTAAHAGRFVFVSSYWVYGRQSPHELPCSEDAELRPIEPYGATKALAEMLVRASGLPCSIVRLTNVFGAGQGGDSREIVSAMAESARDSSVVCVAGDGHETLDLVGLDEACAAIAQLATNSARLSATVNLGSGQAMSVSEVATLVAETAAHELARPVNVEHRAASPGIRFSKAVSVDRLRSLVGYPRQDARAAIRQFVARLVARTG